MSKESIAFFIEEYLCDLISKEKFDNISLLRHCGVFTLKKRNKDVTNSIIKVNDNLAVKYYVAI